MVLSCAYVYIGFMRTRSLTLLALLTVGLVACGDKAQITPDTTPDAFAFAPLAEQKPDSDVSSNAITVSGIDAPAPLSITGGKLLLNGQASSASTVKAGDSVAVQLHTASTPSTSSSASVTIGGVSGTFTVSTAAPTPVQSHKWSDPAIWPSGKVPAAGEQVSLPAGRVILDVSPPALAGLTIPTGSTLVFAEQDLTLQSEWIMVHGELRVGSEAQPFTHQANILLSNAVQGEDVMGMGDRVLGVMDGTLELHGQKRLPWTHLSSTASAGSSTLNLAEAPDWQAGDSLTLSSTDFNGNQTELVTVQRVSGTAVTLAAPLKYTHWASSSSYAGKTLNERAEVGLLSHNIRFGATDDLGSGGLGAQAMLMGASQARIEGAEFLRVGQRNTLRRYPIHFHLLGSQPSSYFRNNSVHDSFNRCITLHGTSDLRVQNNVTYNNAGHCIFLEDGNETGNTISGNLVTRVRNPDSKLGETPLLASDKFAAAYWITNPNNTVTNNVAAGVDGFAFWLAFPEHPTGLGAAAGANTWNRRTPLGAFSGNVAHSGGRGLNVDDGPNPDGTTGSTYYNPLSNPADPNSAAVPATFSDFVAYKMRDHGVWLRGQNLTLTGAVLADNGVGATFASNKTTLTDSVLIGETANVGQPESWEKTGSGGRSLPRPWDASFPVRGFQFYDGHVTIQNTALTNFAPSSVRQASGLGYLTKNAFSLEPDNNAQGLTWLDGSNRVYLPDPQADKDGDRSATFLDTDGSVTGKAGQTVTASPILKDAPDCAANAAWNASVCGGSYARLWLEDVNKGKAGPVTVQNSRSASMTLVGVPDGLTYFSTSVRLGEGYSLTPTGSSAHWRVGLTNSSKVAGSTVSLKLPLGNEPILYRDWWIDERNRLKKVALTDLPSTTGDSYAYEGGQLYLKLVSKASTSAAVDICTAALCK